MIHTFFVAHFPLLPCLCARPRQPMIMHILLTRVLFMTLSSWCTEYLKFCLLGRVDSCNILYTLSSSWVSQVKRTSWRSADFVWPDTKSADVTHNLKLDSLNAHLLLLRVPLELMSPTWVLWKEHDKVLNGWAENSGVSGLASWEYQECTPGQGNLWV